MRMDWNRKGKWLSMGWDRESESESAVKGNGGTRTFTYRLENKAGNNY